jgi:ATP-binding cassette subfamily F protein 3
MLLLQASGVSKSYGVTAILSHISIQIQVRERIGLVGVNGAGKSTLLQILAGEIICDEGAIHKNKETRIGYLAQNSGLHSDETIGFEMRSVFAHLLDVEEELRKLERDMADPLIIQDESRYPSVLERYATRSDWFREQGGYEIDAKIRGILHGMGFGNFPQDTRIHTLSGGQRTRLALAKMLLQEPDLLLLDEPTNHLDITTLTWLENYLRSYPGAIVIVSHDRYFLDATVQTIIEIERHSAKRYTGNYSRFIELKAADMEQQMKVYEKQQDEINKLEDFVQRNIARASTSKRAKSRRSALDRIDRIDRPMGDLKRASFQFEIEQLTGKEVLRTEGLTYAYASGKPLFKNVSLHLRRGDSMALIGPNGTGKTTLLKALIGQLPPNSGNVEWGANTKIGYYDQEQSNLTADHTILEEVWNAYPHMEEARIRTVLGNFLFSGEDVKKKITSLSGGEKARVSLAKLMLLKANVLVLDEPTNHLDLYSKEVLESSLLDYEGTLLFISHDRYFLNKIAERVMEMTPAGVEYFLGNYDDYLDKKQELVEAEAELKNRLAAKTTANASKPAHPQTTSNDYESEKQAKRDERMRQRKLEQLEAKIAELEAQISNWENEMTLPDNFQDFEKLRELQSHIERTKGELEQCYAEWEIIAEA